MKWDLKHTKVTGSPGLVQGGNKRDTRVERVALQNLQGLQSRSIHRSDGIMAFFMPSGAMHKARSLT